jgi:hypothetical protein
MVHAFLDATLQSYHTSNPRLVRLGAVDLFEDVSIEFGKAVVGSRG